MTATKKFYCYAFALMGVTLLISGSCKKEDEPVSAKDIDGNIYKTVRIGNQEWFAENLRTTSYNNGTTIPLVSDNNVWTGLSTAAYCWYNNDQTTYGDTYGALYNWYTINTGKLCPTGWHVPTDAEWASLTDYVGGDSIAGTRLKTTSGWSSDGNGTDKYGFSALPGGYRSGNFGTFNPVGYYGYWWSTAEDASHALRWYMGHDSGSVKNSYGSKSHGLSVRCVRDN